MNNLSILSLNCQRAFKKEPLFKFLASIIKSNEFDILLLQEVSRFVYNYLNDITSNTKYKTAQPIFNNKLRGESIIFNGSFVKKDMFFSPSLYESECSGVAGVILEKDELKTAVFSVQIVSGLRHNKRFKEISCQKKEIEKIIKKHHPDSIIIGGDFNTGLPWEPKNLNNLMEDKFINTLNIKEKTYNSKNIEYDLTSPLNSLLNNFSYLIGKLGINIPLRVDHIFIDKKTAEKWDYNADVNNEVLVSDHQPVRVYLKKVSRFRLNLKSGKK